MWKSWGDLGACMSNDSIVAAVDDPVDNLID